MAPLRAEHASIADAIVLGRARADEGCSLLEALERAERLYRTELAREPANTQARLKLAWCLFLRAIHEAGRESALTEACGPDGAPTPHIMEAVDLEHVSAIMRDCLRQTTAVLHFSRDERERTDVEKIQALIELAGREGLVQGHREEAQRCLLEITRAIVSDSENRAVRRPRRRIDLQRTRAR